MTPKQHEFFMDKLSQISDIPAELIKLGRGDLGSNLNYTVGALKAYMRKISRRLYDAPYSFCLESALISMLPDKANTVIQEAKKMQIELTKEQKKAALRVV